MLSLYDRASIEAVMSQPLDPKLSALLADRLARAEANGLLDQTHIVVIQPGDTEAQIEEEVGFSPLVNPLDGERYGSAGFEPYWSWLGDLGGWYELIHTIGNAGFAFVLLIEKRAGVLPSLLDMCGEA